MRCEPVELVLVNLVQDMQENLKSAHACALRVLSLDKGEGLRQEGHLAIKILSSVIT